MAGGRPAPSARSQAATPAAPPRPRRSPSGGQPPVSAYTASSRTESTLARKGAVATEIRTVGEWPPVWRLATRSPLDYQGLAAVVRTAVEDGDDAVGVKPLEDGARAVWRAALTMDGKQITVVVDQETGIVTWYSDGHDTFTARGRLGIAAAGRPDLRGRRAGGDQGQDDRGRRLHVRRVAGGGGSPSPATLRSSPTWRRTGTP